MEHVNVRENDPGAPRCFVAVRTTKIGGRVLGA